MNRTDLQKLSNVRLREAQVLYKAGAFSGSYYLTGYAIECGLKACFAKNVRRYDFPDRKHSSKLFTHDLAQLVELADLKAQLKAAREASAQFSAGWELVCIWSEQSRYAEWARQDAEAILNAIVRRNDGVLPWIKRYW